MSNIQASAADDLPQNDKPDHAIRRTAEFHPSIWGDLFINYTCDDEGIHACKVGAVEELVAEVRRELIIASSAGTQSPQHEVMNLINALQRLGVAYHFEGEIQEALEHIYATLHLHGDADDDDLYNLALRFRLLRQQGFRVSCGDKKGQFKTSMINTNIPGMLAFYEAAHLRVHGEDILDEALAFTTSQLEPIASCPLNCNSPLLAAQITRALKQPLHKGIPRLEARHYISIYQDHDPSHNTTLLKLAVLDFELVQSLHRQELSHISRWWKLLDFSTKLPFARDRVVECFFCVVAVYFEPQYSFARKILTKVIAMTSTIDDIYDAYGTLEELQIFTEAIERWAISSVDQLPEYMQICYRAVLDIFEEVEQELAKQGRSCLVLYAKEAMKVLVRAYFSEAMFFHEKRIPTMEEYMHVALVTIALPMLTACHFLAFKWIFSNPKIITASSVIARLTDDMSLSKRGHVASSVECYMKQYGVSEEVALEEFGRQITDTWKDINEECTRPIAMPMPLLMRVLNLARAVDVVYKNEDGYTNVGKDVAILLRDPLPK
ncbi:hypothetical protein CIPAW_01G051400 [Carya illinoinensis]|uniref:(-)-germacrene D synthase-like n=1 Tax=Carya illinoinensis TaxID=32201 RepID=A0A8T1RI30_CARIL|nr:hypothetical protein CIPAW_01G051400 [Carya illinoinensis]